MQVVSIPPSQRGLSRLTFLSTIVLFFCAIFLLLLSRNMLKELNHDEHMYVAGGALPAAGSLLPYKDFPYLQMPNLAFIYGALFKLSDHLLLTARLFSTVCAVIAAALVFWVAANVLRDWSYSARFLVGAGCVVLLITNPVFLYTSGHAWNHDLSVLLTLGAFVLFRRGMGGEQSRWPLFFAGALAGLAVGTRLSFAAAIVPFAVLLLAAAMARRARREQPVLFGSGLLLAMVPALLTYLTTPDRFAFGNLDYHNLNVLFWRSLSYDRTMVLPGKLAYGWEVLTQPGTLPLVLVLLVLVLPALASTGIGFIRGDRSGSGPELLLLLGITLSLVLAAFVPTPTWLQYFYASVPFLVLSIPYGTALFYGTGRRPVWGAGLLTVGVAATLYYAVPAYRELGGALRPERWVPVQAHELGLRIRDKVGSGKVLTLAPLYPLEGGVAIYEPLAAGPFTWRSAGFLSEARRRELGVISPDDLSALLASESPSAVLVGYEVGLEDGLLRYAQVHNFSAESLPGGKTLLLAPAITGGD